MFVVIATVLCFFEFLDPQDPWINGTYELPAFESWTEGDGTQDGNVIIVPPNTVASKGWRLYRNFKNIDSDVYTHFYNYCPSDSTPIAKACCYVDLVEGNEAIQYGANANHGSWASYPLKKMINKNMTFNIYLENRNATHSARFLLPQVFPYKLKKQTFPENRVSKSPIMQNVNRYELSFNTVNEEIEVLTKSLSDPHPLPKMLSSENNAFNPGDDRQYPLISPLVLLCNKSHIVGVDVSTIEFWHTWKSNSYSFFSMHLKVRRPFKLSLIVIEKVTESYLDAIEHWHSTFRDIYSPANDLPGGLWMPFADLNTCFKNNTEERDVFLAQNKWGSSTKTKTYLPVFKYYEVLAEHLTVPYNETFDEAFKACRNNEGSYCQRIWNTAARNAKGRIIARSEDEAWNVGSFVYVNFAGSRYQEALNDSTNPKVVDVYNGTGSDSFSITYLDYKTNDHDIDEVQPFYLVDKVDKQLFGPIMATHFKFFQMFNRTAKRGIMTNSAFVMPQLAKYIRSAGFEIRLAQPYLKYSQYYRNTFWQQRFQVGSHTMSMLENSERAISLEYAEGEFSIQLSLGSFPSYFSYNAATDNFWSNCNDLAQMKPIFTRWNNVLKTTLGETEFFANCMGLVKQYIPTEGQNPALTTTNEINDFSMFCEKPEKVINGKRACYVNILLGYSGDHSVGSAFVRKAVYSFAKTPTVFFTAQDLTATVQGNNVTLEMKGLSQYHTYRAASIKIVLGDDDKSGNSTVLYIIGGVTIASLTGAAIFFLYRKPSEIDPIMSVSL